MTEKFHTSSVKSSKELFEALREFYFFPIIVGEKETHLTWLTDGLTVSTLSKSCLNFAGEQSGRDELQGPGEKGERPYYNILFPITRRIQTYDFSVQKVQSGKLTNKFSWKTLRHCSVLQPCISFDFSWQYTYRMHCGKFQLYYRYIQYSDVCSGELSGWRDVLHYWLWGRSRGRGGGRGSGGQTGQTYLQTPAQPRELPAVQGAVTWIMTSFVTHHSWCRRSWPRSGRSRPRCQAGARRADTRAVWTGTRRQDPGHSSQAQG